ncbi:hypothetical protein EW146_g4930 [Bondarzewia mesenterica]|uniref:RNB domain-containing protein n=1 Tax=Bondarzewia mesenterica TaxID=1095465 RepID=A0A4S4LUU0_9AGAM|nr:hypothetical protein EW146_g4930 [Bondarzewia mesenterica]
MRHQHLQSIHALLSQFDARIVDVSENSVIVEISGKTTRVVAFLSLVKPFGIIESAGTDNALSIKLDDDGTYDVGVHICLPRSTPVLSPALSQELCSLNPGQERLASSVIPTMTKGTKVIKKWSAAKLSYSEAQGVIEDKPLGGVPVMPEHNASAVEHDIRVSQDLAKELQTACFTLDDSGIPIDCSQYEHRESNQLVEEFIRLTNITVAQQIAVNLPEQALLRRHPVSALFYSPLDAAVHHQLESVLQGTGNNKFSIDRDAAAKVTQQCNIKRDSVKPDQEQSVRLYLCVLISDFTSPYGSVVR